MARFKNAVFLLILIFLFVEVLIIFPQHLEKIESDPPSAKKANDKSGAEQKMKGVHYSESRHGTRDWELFAQAAEGYQSKGTWELSEVKVQFYNLEKLDLTVTGKNGEIDTKTKNIKIIGDVVIVSANGYRFESQEVTYASDVRQIIIPRAILLKAPKDQQGEGLRVQGGQMVVDVDTSKMTMKNQIHAVKVLSSSKKLDLTSDQAEFNGRSRETHFTGNVVIHYGLMKLEAPSAAFIYRKDKDQLKNILLSGGVRASDEDKYAVSDQMNLDIEGNKFTFDGRPRVYQDNDELSGEQIVFLDGGKKVKVENIRGKYTNPEKLKKDGGK